MGYQSGTITLKDGTSVQGQVKIGNPRFSPDQIYYRLNDETEEVVAGPEDIQGFSLGNNIQFVSAKVQIDISSEVLRKMNTAQLPSWKVRQVFLKKVLDSNTSLYLYKAKEYSRFFYQHGENGEFVQLIYKRYLLNANSSATGENFEFRNQLQSNFNCLKDTRFVETLKYNVAGLTDFFTRQNNCEKFNVEAFKSEKIDRNLIVNFKVGVAAVNADLQIEQRINGPKEIDIEGGSLFRGDFELEYKMSLSKNPISLFANLGFEKFNGVGIWKGRRFRSATDVNEIIEIDQQWVMDVFSLGLSVGVRKYLTINESTQMFASAAIAPSFTYILSDIEISPSEDPRVLEFEQNFSGTEGTSYLLGFGIKHKSVLFELRYFTSKDILGNLEGTDAQYSNFAISMGLSL